VCVCVCVCSQGILVNGRLFESVSLRFRVDTEQMVLLVHKCSPVIMRCVVMESQCVCSVMMTALSIHECVCE